MKPIVLVVGCPGAGKSWVCENIGSRFLYVPHDDFNERVYPEALARAASPAKPVIGEIPFGLYQIQRELTGGGFHVHPVFVVADEAELRRRWKERKLVNPSTINGHLTRQETFRERAKELAAFIGSSAQVLEHLRKLPL